MSEWFQVLLFNTNSSIQNYSFVCTQLKGSKYFYVILIIQFNISHLHTVKWFQKRLNISIWTIDWTPTGTTTPGPSEPESNDNEGVLHIPQTSRLESHHQM